MLFDFLPSGSHRQHLSTTTVHSAHLVDDFICGSLLSATLGILFYPNNVLKTRMQSFLDWWEISVFSQGFPKILVRIGQETNKSVQRNPFELPLVPHLLGHNQCDLGVLVNDYMKEIIS